MAVVVVVVVFRIGCILAGVGEMKRPYEIGDRAGILPGFVRASRARYAPQAVNVAFDAKTMKRVSANANAHLGLTGEFVVAELTYENTFHD